MRSQKKKREERHQYASARDRAEKKQQQASFSATYLKMPAGAKLFKPKVGIMLLDILPYKVGEGNPCADEGLLHYERTYHLHPRVSSDGNPYLCPRLTSKSPCPICEYRQKLLKQSDPENEDIIKETAPKERQLFNVINLKDPDAGVQIWDMSYHLFGKLLDARIRNSDEDDGWDQFAALEGGMTLKVAFKEKSFGGRNFLEAETIDFKPRSEDYEESILDDVHCLDELLIEPEYDELKEVFLEASSSDEKPAAARKHKPAEDEDDDEDEDEEPTPKKKKPSPVEDDDEDEPAPKKKKPAPDDEDDEDDDEEPPAPKKPKKDDDDFDDFDDDDDAPPAKKKSTKPEEDDDEDEDDEDEDGDDEEPVRKPYKRPSRAKVKPAPEEDDDEDDDEDPPRIRTKKQVEGDEDEDEDEDDDEDDDGSEKAQEISE